MRIIIWIVCIFVCLKKSSAWFWSLKNFKFGFYFPCKKKIKISSLKVYFVPEIFFIITKLIHFSIIILDISKNLTCFLITIFLINYFLYFRFRITTLGGDLREIYKFTNWFIIFFVIISIFIFTFYNSRLIVSDFRFRFYI